MPISHEELGRRLRAAREALGHTQEDAAKALDLARPAITEIEAGRRGVSSLELYRLAGLYGRDLTEFLAPDFSGEDALRAVFRAQPTLEMDSALRKTLLDWRKRARALTDLETALELPRRLCTAGPYPSAPLTSRWNAIQQGERLAEEERARLGLGRAPVGDLPTLLESQGIRTALEPLPDDISGLTLQERSQNLLIMVNREHAPARHRFSFAHEYAHVLIDRERGSIVSRAEDRDELTEMRANSFAAGFLMPVEGVLEYVRELGKGQGSRETAVVYDDSEAQPLKAEARAGPRSQALQMYDVIQAAEYFGVSRMAMIYRFKTLRLIKQPEVDALVKAEQQRWNEELNKLFADGAPEKDESVLSAFQRRFVATVLEAYRREVISGGKLRELGRLIALNDDQLETMLNEAAAIDDEITAGGLEKMITPVEMIVVTDTSVVINLLHVRRLEMMARLTGIRLALPEEVIAEVTREEQRSALEAALKTGTIDRCGLDPLAGADLLAEFQGRLGLGELACLALAEQNGWTIVSDERGLFRTQAIQRVGPTRLLGTVDLYLRAIRGGAIPVEDADADKAVLATKRCVMRFGSFQELL